MGGLFFCLRRITTKTHKKCAVCLSAGWIPVGNIYELMTTSLISLISSMA